MANQLTAIWLRYSHDGSELHYMQQILTAPMSVTKVTALKHRVSGMYQVLLDCDVVKGAPLSNGDIWKHIQRHNSNFPDKPMPGPNLTKWYWEGRLVVRHVRPKVPLVIGDLRPYNNTCGEHS